MRRFICHPGEEEAGRPGAIAVALRLSTSTGGQPTFTASIDRTQLGRQDSLAVYQHRTGLVQSMVDVDVRVQDWGDELLPSSGYFVPLSVYLHVHVHKGEKQRLTDRQRSRSRRVCQPPPMFNSPSQCRSIAATCRPTRLFGRVPAQNQLRSTGGCQYSSPLMSCGSEIGLTNFCQPPDIRSRPP
ncbi:hypothetical protein BD310DRAFT_425917 [Dichomitus squalens]|uniref:Uncharacterized protein n=1 Tax=Dichomitus squalens TaxID=114155 RepID=A0A4Q9PWY8_9APHY|nr:hypothetical protein BD310DRAFT_425917 [Dichomitus squalens]